MHELEGSFLTPLSSTGPLANEVMPSFEPPSLEIAYSASGKDQQKMLQWEYSLMGLVCRETFIRPMCGVFEGEWPRWGLAAYAMNFKIRFIYVPHVYWLNVLSALMPSVFMCLMCHMCDSTLPDPLLNTSIFLADYGADEKQSTLGAPKLNMPLSLKYAPCQVAGTVLLFP